MNLLPKLTHLPFGKFNFLINSMYSKLKVFKDPLNFSEEKLSFNLGFDDFLSQYKENSNF